MVSKTRQIGLISLLSRFSVPLLLTPRLDLPLKLLGIFLGGVQPHFAPMRLHRRLEQIATDLRHRNLGDDLAFDHLIPQFSMRPKGDRTPRQRGRLAGQSHDQRDLLWRDFPRRARSWRVGQHFQNGFPQPERLATFPDAQRIPRIPPTLTPNAHLLSVEADLGRDLFIPHPLEPDNTIDARCAMHFDSVRERRNSSKRTCCRSVILTFAAFPGMISLSMPSQSRSGQNSQTTNFMKCRFRGGALAKSYNCTH